MCIFSQKSKEFRISGTELRKLIESKYALPGLSFWLWDREYYYLSHTAWGEVFREALYNMPKYTVDKFDCENFGMLLCCRISEREKLNTCGIAIGQGPGGPHGFNAFISDIDGEPEIFLIEPQTGEIFSLFEDSGYLPELIIFG